MCVACDVEVGVSFDDIGSFFVVVLFLYAGLTAVYFECVCFSFVLIVRFVFLCRYSCFHPALIVCLFVCVFASQALRCFSGVFYLLFFLFCSLLLSSVSFFVFFLLLLIIFAVKLYLPFFR